MLSPTDNCDSKSDEKADDNDSPAFRLRPRRSTPKPSPSPLNGLKYSILKNSRFLSLTNNQDAAVAVKRKLFRLPKFDDPEIKAEKVVAPCPENSIVEDVRIGVFVERVEIDKLNQCGDYPSNYISLRIVNISKDVVVNGTERCVLTVLTQEASDNETELNMKKPVLPVFLYDNYASSPCLEVGKILDITKFKTEVNLTTSYVVDDCDIQAMPYKVIVKPAFDPIWIPFLNVRSIYQHSVEENMLPVSSIKCGGDSLSPMRFTSYCTKVDPESLSRRQSIQSSSSSDSEAIDNSLKSSPQTALSDTGNAMRRKRVCRSTSDLIDLSVSTPQKREKQRRACSSSHV